MENVYFQCDRRNLRASSCLAASAEDILPGTVGHSHGKKRVIPLVHGVAEFNEGLVGVFEANEAPTGIFNLKCGIDG
jgi:hypothetical protein